MSGMAGNLRPADGRPWLRSLGRTGLLVSGLTAGTSKLGSEVPPDTAALTIDQVLNSPIRTIDTANEYSAGESERLIGAALADTAPTETKLADLVVLTKVDRDPRDNSFTGARVRQSLTESLQRLRIERLPLIFLHDPQKMTRKPGQSVFDAVTEPGGPLEGLLQLKQDGLIDAVGVAAGLTSLMEPLVRLDVFDAVLTHNRFTLVDRSASRLLDIASRTQAGVLNAAVFGGSILAKPAGATTVYAYQQAAVPVLGAIQAMEHACARHDVPLAAAALQFSLREPRVHSTVVGVSTPERVGQAIRLAETEIPDELWEELETLVPAPQHWLDAG
jgi:D-threo-aldose 1-dehydrogenase